VAAVEELTVPAVTVNVTEVAPAGTVTLAGTLAAVVLELESVTTAPPVPAAAVRLTVPVPDWLLTIVLGLTDKLLNAPGSGFTVRPNVLLTPEYVAVKVTVKELITPPVLTVNVAEVAPCGTVTVAGTLAAAVSELESDTATPPVPAASVKVTVPVPVRPLMIELKLTERLLKAGGGGLTVTPNVAFTPE
jgi:hypothetical protein